jgi:hypothetical protein
VRRLPKIAPVVVVTLIAGGGLALASTFYEIAVGSHGGARLDPLTLAADFAGGVLALTLALQLATGMGYFTASRRQVRLHANMWRLVLAVLVFHGLQGALHAFQPPWEPSPLVLVGIGAILLVAMVAQARNGRFSTRRAQQGMRAQLSEHTSASLVIGGIALAHVVIGTVHAITG